MADPDLRILFVFFFFPNVSQTPPTTSFLFSLLVNYTICRINRSAGMSSFEEPLGLWVNLADVMMAQAFIS
jgi:hypothetical protein